MLIEGYKAEQAAIIRAAEDMCAAARTAPKTKGDDFLVTGIVTGEDLETLAVEMERISRESGAAFVARDAGNVRKSGAVVLIGVKNVRRGLSDLCQLCNFATCEECAAANGVCIYGPIDAGIAIGSAAAAAADRRVDSRVMFSAGQAARSLGWPEADLQMVFALPVSVSAKSPYFDRK